MNQQPDEQPGQSNRQHQDSDAVSDKDALARDDNPSAHNDGKLSKRRAHDDASRIAGETDSPVGAVEGKTATEQERDEHERRAVATGKSAFLVGAGILISRIVGLVRQRVFAYYFGTSDAADVFNAAFRIPNFLQNIFGEGALSASFIPVYANLLARGDKKEATHVADAVLTLLALVTSIIVLIGVLTTPYLINLIAPGFEGEKREWAIRLVKILF